MAREGERLKGCGGVLETARLGECVERLRVGDSESTAGSQEQVERNKVSESAGEEMKRWQLVAAVGVCLSGPTVHHTAVRVSAAHLALACGCQTSVAAASSFPVCCWFALSAETSHVDRQNC